MTATAPERVFRAADRYGAVAGRLHLTGVQALARVPMDQRRADLRAGLRTAAFISGYEGSPLAGYDLELGRQQQLLDALDIVLRPGLNEELAATSVQGTQLAGTLPDLRVDGVTGYWYGKSPGLDRASDAMRHNNLGGTHALGGAVAFVGDDPGAKSSTVPGWSDALLADLGIPTLYPADPQDVVDLGLHAVALSRASGLWCALKIATAVADGSGQVIVDPDRIAPRVPTVTVDGRPFVHHVTGSLLQPVLAELEQSRNGPRRELALAYARLNALNGMPARTGDDRIGVLAAGKTYLDVRQALLLLGLDDAELSRRGVRLGRLGMTSPLDPEFVREFATGLTEVVVVEEKRGLVETAVKDALYASSRPPRVSGKTDPAGVALFADHGELDADSIAAGLARRLHALGGFPSVIERDRRSPTLLPLATRTPYFCSGCPHNRSTQTPDGSLVGAGIGCHGLVLGMRPEQVGNVSGLTQMGGEGAQWIGIQPFVERDHLLQNIGDGTFHHSGSLAVRAAVAAGVNITYKLLYNSTVAMTGGQDAVGLLAVPDLARALLAEGVRRIVVTTDDPTAYRRVRLPRGAEVWHRDRLIEAQEVLSRTPGVTVLIHDQECATELRRKRKRGLAPDPAHRVVINERVCEGCGDCGAKSNCLSVHPVATEFGRKTRIEQSSCNRDDSCLDGDCPSFITVVGGGAVSRTDAVELAADAVPPPPPREIADPCTVRILGIGGSGVVTVAQVLGSAAAIAGRHVVTLDQTGLAQKGGAVVSDLKITTEAAELSARAADGQADLYIGCDLLVAADGRYLRAADPGRTVAVVSVSVVPTGAMVSDAGQEFPPVESLVAAIDRGTVAGAGFQVDARAASTRLFGSDQYANLILIGAAHQLGTLPIPAQAVEEAIQLVGISVERNIQAFRRGRQSVADPAAWAVAVRTDPDPATRSGADDPAVAELLELVDAPDGSELRRLLEIRVPDLVAYQDRAYARRFVQAVARVARRENEQLPGSTAVAESVARNLYKLMAYKDEYEVARLSLDPGLIASLHATYGPDARISFRLHPPVLRALGMKRKIGLDHRLRIVFRLLAAARRVRGTALDPFGYAKVRRLERRLIVEYLATVDEVTGHLDASTVGLVTTITDLPDAVRGYEAIKVDSAERYRARTVELCQELRAAAARTG